MKLKLFLSEWIVETTIKTYLENPKNFLEITSNCMFFFPFFFCFYHFYKVVSRKLNANTLEKIFSLLRHSHPSCTSSNLELLLEVKSKASSFRAKIWIKGYLGRHEWTRSICLTKRALFSSRVPWCSFLLQWYPQENSTVLVCDDQINIFNIECFLPKFVIGSLNLCQLYDLIWKPIVAVALQNWNGLFST